MNSIEVQSPIANGVPQSAQMPKAITKKVSELPLLENRNWLIHLHYSRREFGICKILIEEELEKSNGMCEHANYIQGLILRNEGKIQESLEYFQTCHTLNPRNINNIKQVARSLYLLGRHSLAIEAYLEAESVANKADWDIYHNLGMCLVHVSELDKAREYMLTAIDLSHQETSYEALATIHLMANDIQGAINTYTKALEWYPDSCDLATSLGLLYMKTGQHQRAFEKLGSALAHDPSCTRALIAAGSMMQGHQDFDVALSKYKIAAQYLPESTTLWNNIGMCFFEKKKYVAAISCLKRANYLSPFDWKTLYNLGLVHLTTQQYASAFHFVSAAINLHPDDASGFMLLALALKNLGDPENAAHAFKQAMKLNSNDPTIVLNYAILLHSIGDKEQASIQMQHFQQLCKNIKNLDQQMLITAKNLSASLSNVTETKTMLEDVPPELGPDEV